MADQPFDRTIVNPLTRPLVGDINQAQSTLDLALRYFARQLFAPATGGFVGAGLKVVPSGVPGTVVVSSGLGFVTDVASVPVAIGGITGLDDRSSWKPIVLPTALSVGVPAPPGADSRIDVIEVRYNRRVGDPSARAVFNTLSGAFDPGTANTSLSFALLAADLTYNGAGAVNYKTGTPSASPTVLSLSAGYLRLATVRVATGSTSYAKEQLTDERDVLWAGGSQSVVGSFTLTAAGVGSVLTGLQAPPGTSVDITVFASSFIVTVSGQWAAAAISVGLHGQSTATIVPLFRTRAQYTTISADKADMDNPAKNIAFTSAVNADQACVKLFVDLAEQATGSPFNFVGALTQAYDVTFQVCLRA